MVFVKFHNMKQEKKFFLMSPLNSNNLKIFTLQVKTILQSQFTDVQFSFLLFFNLCTVYFTKNVCSFFLFFLYMLCPTMFKFFSFFFCPFSIVLYLFVFVFIFFIINCSFNVPLFSNLISTSLCLYLNTITIGSLPRLFNFDLYFRKIKTFLNSLRVLFFFFLAQNIPFFFFPKQPKLLSIQPTFLNSKQFQSRIPEFSLHLLPSKFCASLNYLQNPVSKYLPQ